jgi:hypothetical protein
MGGKLGWITLQNLNHFVEKLLQTGRFFKKI